jgi:hypothetical protein
MTNGVYVDFYDFDSNKVEELLKSTNNDDKVNAILFTVLGSNDYFRSDELTFQFLQSGDFKLMEIAIVCVGHIVRIHKKIDLNRYFPILDNILTNQNEQLVYSDEGALEDIWIFSDKEISKEFSKNTLSSIFLEVLHLREVAENSGNYVDGIKKLEKLRTIEPNLSIQRLISTCIENLNYFVDEQIRKVKN